MFSRVINREVTRSEAMHIQLTYLRALTSLLLLLTSPLVPADEAADRAAIEAHAQAWAKAFDARDMDALIAVTTEDVLLMDSNMPPVSGRKAARNALQQAFGNAKGQVATTTKEIQLAGDFAWRIAALTHKTAHETISGQALEIWQRVDGKWQLHRQMSSTILAPSKLRRPPLSEPVLDGVEKAVD
jgi:ketosteroid isomerase-like protein